MITASRISTAAACTASLVLPQRREVHAGQAEGDERHLELETSIDLGTVPPVIEARWPGYTWRSEVAFVIDLATEEGREIGQGIQRNYGDVGAFAIAGTADLVGRGPNDELVIVDRKSFDPNVPRAAVNGQLHTLVLAACRAYGLDAAEVAIWHEVRPLDVAQVGALDLDVFTSDLRTLLKRAAVARQKFRMGILNTNPGPQCRWCDAFHDCPEQKALIADSDANLPMRIEASLPFKEDKEAADAFELLGRIELLAKRIRAALYARAGERPIPLNDGRVLGPREKLSATEIDLQKGYATLLNQFGPQIANDCMTKELTQASIKRALAKHGHAGRFKEVVERLKETGAAKRETRVVVEVHE